MIWVAFAVSAFAAAVDLQRREIPDACPVFLVAAALVTGFVPAGLLPWADVGWTARLVGGGAALGIAAVLFYLGGFGGGDAKLLGALGFAIGATETWTLLFWTAMAGAVIGLVARRRGAREVVYGPAIAMGVLVTAAARSWTVLAPFTP